MGSFNQFLSLDPIYNDINDMAVVCSHNAIHSMLKSDSVKDRNFFIGWIRDEFK